MERKELVDLKQWVSCPITGEVFTDPVVAADGHTYERKAIELWFRVHKTSPMTREVIADTDLILNRALRGIIASRSLGQWLRVKNYTSSDLVVAADGIT